jgi:hypothetical protein
MRPSLRSSVLAALLGTRLPVLLLGVAAVTVVGTIPPPTAEAVWRVSPNELDNLLARWDTDFYHSIATHGYHWNPTVFSHQNVVFFPLYPFLMRLGGYLLGGHPLAAGLIISLVSFSGAVAILYRLAADELGDAHAWPVVLLLSTYPFALFYSVAYTEALFLFLSVGAFYAMRRGSFLAAALFGLGAGLTRPNGFWLTLPLFMIAVARAPAPASAPSRDTPPEERIWWTKKRAIGLIVAFGPVIGTALFCWYLSYTVGDALAWMHGQAAWGFPLLGRPPAPDPIRTSADRLTVSEMVTWAGNIAAFVAAVVAIVPVARRFGFAYSLWIAVNIFPPVAAHLFLSIGRFTAVLFPLFFWFATLVPRRALARVAAGFAFTQAVFAVWFFLWRPVV